jgi:hypothetical protein
MRRDFSLPSEDLDWLESLHRPYELVRENGSLRVIIHEWPLPAGYDQGTASINVRIEPGYPDAQIDMAYFYPPINRADGRQISALASDVFDGKNWQRWSRHRTPANPWRPGIDNLATHFGLVEDWLHKELRRHG